MTVHICPSVLETAPQNLCFSPPGNQPYKKPKTESSNQTRTADPYGRPLPAGWDKFLTTPSKAERELQLLTVQVSQLMDVAPDHQSPFALLPKHLLAIVFRYYLDCDDDSDWETELPTGISTQRDVCNSALTISHVCSSWRAVTLAHQSFWSRISIMAPKVHQIPLLRLWLQRSGTLPLDIYVHCVENSQLDRDLAMEAMLAILAEQSPRWKDLSLTLSRNVQHAFYNLQLADSVNQLESIELDLEEWDPAPANFLCASLHTSTALRRGSWNRSCGDDIPCAVPWAQMTHLNLAIVPTSFELEYILSRCHETLESLEIGILPCNWIDCSVNRDNLRLPHLRRFKAGTIHDLGYLFDFWHAPALEDLEIMRGFGCAPGDAAEAAEFLQVLEDSLGNMKCRLRSLVLNEQEVEIKPEVLLACLGSEPFGELEELYLFLPVADEVLHGLCEPSPAVVEGSEAQALPMLPKLRTLVLDSCQATDGVLTTLVQSRFRPNAQRETLGYLRARMAQAGKYKKDIAFLQELDSTLISPFPVVRRQEVSVTVCA